jgi:hypothetical protein
MLKRVFRKAIRMTHEWLREPDPRSDPNSGLARVFAFPELNALAERITEELGDEARPAYTWGVVRAAHLARTIGIDRISAIEFGVAGGGGLVSLDRTAQRAEQALGVGIDVYGFDTGSGLPKPVDYRDLPNLYVEGGYPMDEPKLRARLDRAVLLLGLVHETLPRFLEARPAPISFISFDLDLYSSTSHALAALATDPALLMPRIYCYFDDIMEMSFGDHNGERLAISEFNENHALRKISPVYGLRFYLPKLWADSEWAEKFYMAHVLDHERYGQHDGLVKTPRADLVG